MHHPYQTITHISPAGSQDSSFLLVASGSKLLCINLADGTIASRWPANRRQSQSEISEEKKDDAPAQEPPSKRRKVEQIEQDPNIINIAATPDGQYAVVVTGEDKGVRVFSISQDGQVEQISQRFLGKRPSAITLIDNGRTIVSADKFGDVHSLPLLPSIEEEAAAKIAAQKNAKSLRVKASETTVHSKANMKTLEFQRKQEEQNLPVKTKDSMEFAHNFLLGHISMITDIISAQLPTRQNSSIRKTHLVTSDRDEHIRVSRGPPQSFVIERYCLGPKEYISKLCLVSEDMLVSGGGDDELFVWDLRDGCLIATVSIKAAVDNFRSARDDDFRIAVSGLWLYPAHGETQARLIVALEGQPMLFHCQISSLSKNAVLETRPLPGNLLDIAIASGLVIVSLDNIHSPGSTKDVNTSTDVKTRLQVISFVEGDKSCTSHLQHKLVEANGLLTTEWNEKKLQSLLYSTDVLRKRQDTEDGEGGEE